MGAKNSAGRMDEMITKSSFLREIFKKDLYRLPAPWGKVVEAMDKYKEEEIQMTTLQIAAEGLHTKPITVGELEYIYDTLHSLYKSTVENEDLPLPDNYEATEMYQTAANIIEKILTFEEIADG